MAVFRIHKSKDYTVMSNHHLRNKNLSLKAKGLLSTMLSLPDEWDYSIAGLTSLAKDGKDSVMSTLDELELSGYIKMDKVRDDKGRFFTTYDVFEFPNGETRCGKSESDNPPQLNTNILSSDTISSRTIDSTPTSTIPTNNNKVLNNSKKKDKKESSNLSFENKFDLSFVGIQFEETFKKWLTYKQERNEMYKTQMTVEGNYRKLLNMANNDPWIAQQIVDETIAGGWMGYVMPKSLSNGISSNQTKQSQRGFGNNPYIEAGITAKGLW